MKERLTGAIVLVGLIVLLVPELLSGPKGRSAPAPASTAATSPEEPPLRSYTIKLGDDSRSRAAAPGNSGPAMPQPNGVEQPAIANAVADAGSQAGGPPARGSQTASSPASGSSQAASSQVAGSQAATGSRASSAQHASSLTAGPPAHTQTNAPRAAPPRVAKAAPPKATNPSPPKAESGWAVQLGVFASRENAERLALEVRTKGFKVSVSPITSGSRKLYKVRVGPAPDRSAAQELQGRLKASGRPAGTVVPYS